MSPEPPQAQGGAWAAPRAARAPAWRARPVWRSSGLLAGLLAGLLSYLPSPAHATGLLELTLGGAHPLGGELDGGFGPGGGLLLGFGGQLPKRAHGTALYGYVAVTLDSITQRASLPLSGELSHTLATTSFGGRLYWTVAPSTRLWADLGAGVLYDSATITIEGFEDEAQSMSATSYALTGSFGVQYKLRPRLLLSAGYYAAWALEDEAALAERALRVSAARASWGRGRAALGVAWSF